MPRKTINRAERDDQNPYRLINRHAMEDDRLSFEARGVLAYVLVKPDNWKIQISDLRRAGNIGRDKVYRILNELVEHGYVVREAERRPDGTIAEMQYSVYEKPQEAEDAPPDEQPDAEQLPEKPDTAEPDTAEPDTAEPDTENTDGINNKEGISNKEDVTKEETARGNVLPYTPSATPTEHRNGSASPAPVSADALEESFDPPTDKTPRVQTNGKQKRNELLDVRKVMEGYIPGGEGESGIEVYHEIYHMKNVLSKTQREAIFNTVTDLDLWRKAVTEWNLAGNRAGNIKGMLDWYRDPQRLPSAAHNRTNGHANHVPSATADLTFRGWLMRTYQTDSLTVLHLETNKSEQELRNEYDEWNQQRFTHPRQPGK